MSVRLSFPNLLRALNFCCCNPVAQGLEEDIVGFFVGLWGCVCLKKGFLLFFPVVRTGEASLLGERCCTGVNSVAHFIEVCCSVAWAPCFVDVVSKLWTKTELLIPFTYTYFNQWHTLHTRVLSSVFQVLLFSWLYQWICLWGGEFYTSSTNILWTGMKIWKFK